MINGPSLLPITPHDTMVANIEELPTSSWQALPALIVIVVLARLLYTLFFSPFKDIPGPFAAKFTRVWQFFNLRASTDMPQVLLDLHKKHGGITSKSLQRSSAE